jgi:hypothetical protein
MVSVGYGSALTDGDAGGNDAGACAPVPSLR